MKKMQLFFPTISYFTFLGGQFRQISRYLGFLKAVLTFFSSLSSLFFLDLCSRLEKRKDKSTKVSF